MEASVRTAPPCEVCARHVTYDEDNDEYPEDLYRASRPGTRAHRAGYRFSRICGRCVKERPEDVAAVVKRENETRA